MRRTQQLFGLLIVVLVVSLGLTACGGKGSGSSAKELIVLEWAGYEMPEYRAEFVEQHPDAEVKFTFFADDAEGFAKSKSGFKADIVHPCTNYWDLYIQNGLVQPLDTSKLKYWSGIYPKLAKQGEFEGKQYFIPWDWGYESILVRSDKVQNIPTSWADLWNSEYAGHLSVIDAGENMYMITALSLGLDPWDVSPETVELVRQRLLELKPNIMHYWSDYTELNTLVASGDIWVAGNAWNDAYTAMLAEGVPVEYVSPKEGRIAWVCGYGIAADVKNLDLAYDYLNALMEPAANAQMATDFAYGPGNANSVPLMDQDLVKLLQLDDPSVIDSSILQAPITDEMRQVYTDLWVEIKAAP